MEINQSDEGQRNPSLNNPHPSRQIDSGGGDHFTKAPNTNGGPKRRFTKAPNLKNSSPKKQAKSPDITHHKDPNRTEKAWWRPPANGVQKRPPNQGFLGGQYGFFGAWPARHAIHGKLGQKRDDFPKTKRFSKLISTV